MAYVKQNFETGQTLTAYMLNHIEEGFDGVQDTLVSGTNIKTINGQSLLGTGNLEISGMSDASAALLITILRNGVYASNQYANITALAGLLGAPSGGQPGGGDAGGDTGGDTGGSTPPATKTYTITNSLTNVSTSNTAKSVNENTSYNATLTASSGFVLDSVVVTMGGTNITSTAYANGKITIASVTGNVVIVASAIAQSAGEAVTVYKTASANAMYMFNYDGLKYGKNPSLYPDNELIALDVSAYTGRTLRITAAQNVIDKGDANGLAHYAIFTNGLIKDSNGVEVQLDAMPAFNLASNGVVNQDKSLVVDSFNVSVTSRVPNTVDKVVPEGAVYLYVNNFSTRGAASIELL